MPLRQRKRRNSHQTPSACAEKTRLIQNAHFHRGNHHISVEGLSLDWNVERLGNEERTAAGNNRSSCLTFAHVTFGWVKMWRRRGPACMVLMYRLPGIIIWATAFSPREGAAISGWTGSRQADSVMTALPPTIATIALSQILSVTTRVEIPQKRVFQLQWH